MEKFLEFISKHSHHVLYDIPGVWMTVIGASLISITFRPLSNSQIMQFGILLIILGFFQSIKQDEINQF